ncbi:upstream stimulatory factor 2-like isoform X2 [Oscarella lobularis]|uniref:upstream stimulatory factor 2-like isoform X2 n=1 Tax=Oscarella lobularis TaxID=121494 RepID=UPI0033133CDF
MTQSPSTTVPAQISTDPMITASDDEDPDTSRRADESASAAASHVTESEVHEASSNGTVVIASTEILQTSAGETVAASADAQATVIGAEQVLELSPTAATATSASSASRNDVPKLLSPSQVFHTTQAGSISQQVIGATDADGRFFLFSAASGSGAGGGGGGSGGGGGGGGGASGGSSGSATGGGEQAAAQAVVSGDTVPGIIPGVQFAQAAGGQFYVMLPTSAAQTATQEAAAAVSVAGQTGQAAQVPHRTIAPRVGAEQANVSVTMKAPTVSRAMRDDRRRSTHNEVERRRRDKINAWISELAKIIPECQEDTSKQGQSKGGVLAKTVDYIQELQATNSRMVQMLQEHEQVLMEKQMLKARLSDVEKENAILKGLLM